MKRKLCILALLLLIPAFTFSAWVKQVSGTTKNLRSVWAFYGPVSPWTAVAVGDSGTILISTDLGQTWTPGTSPTTQTLFGVAQDLSGDIPKHWGSAVGGDTAGVILRTTDDGVSWSTRAAPPTVMHAVSFADSMNGMAVGESNAIWGTTDGGFTWTQKSSPFPGNWNGIFVDYYNTHIAWVCGEDGKIIETTNAGATWSAQTSGTTATLRALSFLYAGPWCGVAVGDSGRILRTTNNGLNWMPVSSGVTDDLFDTYYGWGVFRFTVGANGRILRGSWDGSTWVPESSGTTRTLHGVNYLVDVSGFHIWAVGDSGTILYKFILSGVENSSSALPELYPSCPTASPNPFISHTTIPGHPSDRFTLYDISGRKVGIYKGDRIGDGLPHGVYFLRPDDISGKPLRIVKVR